MGSVTPGRFTKDQITESALKYTSKKEWYKDCAKMYRQASRIYGKDFFKSVTAHTSSGNGILAPDVVNPMGSKTIIDSLHDGANLTSQELEKVYHNDYSGPLGVVKSAYLGLSSRKKEGSPEIHRYLALFNDDGGWSVTHLYVTKGSPTKGMDALSMDFEGNADDFDSEEKANKVFNDYARVHQKPQELDQKPPMSPADTLSNMSPGGAKVGPFGSRYRYTGYQSRGNKWQDQQYRDTQDRGWA